MAAPAAPGSLRPVPDGIGSFHDGLPELKRAFHIVSVHIAAACSHECQAAVVQPFAEDALFDGHALKRREVKL